MGKTRFIFLVLLLLLLVMTVIPSPVLAGPPVFEIEIKDHLFSPAELTVPAGVKVKLVVKNLDKTPEEFESYELNREKVVMGRRKVIVFIGPLAPGEYPFFGEFHPKTAQGKIIAK
ncbi:MAG: cupredoxin domain-containing protein [Nitrospiria bacterium]